MKQPGWEKRLNAVIERHMALPSQYGVSDCFLMPMDAVEAVTGIRHFPEDRAYKSEVGAAKRLRKRGFATVEDAFASLFETVSQLSAERGDIGVVEIAGVVCGGVFTVLGFAVRDAIGVQFLPITHVKTAFRVI